MFSCLDIDSDNDSDNEQSKSDNEQSESDNEQSDRKSSNFHMKISESDEQSNNDIKHSINNNINESNTPQTNNQNKSIKQSNKKNKQQNDIPKINKNKILKQLENTKTLYVEDINLTVSNKTIIENSHIVINENIKYFVLGENGSGKTTLLNYLYDKLKNSNIGNVLMLHQHVDIIDKEQTCLEYILESELQTKYLELTELNNKMSLTWNIMNNYQIMYIQKTIMINLMQKHKKY